MEKEQIRFYVKTRTLLKIQARIIHEELCSAYANEVPCLSTIEQWSKRFREGEEDVKDKERSGRPVTETTVENIEEPFTDFLPIRVRLLVLYARLLTEPLLYCRHGVSMLNSKTFK